MNSKVASVAVAALILLVGVNAGYFIPKFVPAAGQPFTLQPEAYALSTPSSYLTFQGQLADQNGVPVTTAQSLAFSLYDASSSGTLIYNETQSVTPDSRGIFYVEIGSGTAGSPAGGQSWPPSFSVPYWLAVRVGSHGSYLSPRMALTASPYLLGSYLSSLIQGSHTLTGSVTFVNSTSIGLDVYGQNVQLKLLSQTCTSGQYVTAVGNSVTCSAAVVSISQGARTAQGALTFVNSTTIGVEVVGQNLYFKVSSVPWSLLTSFPSACASHNWVTGASSSAFTCSQPSWADIANIPANCPSGEFYTSLSSGTCDVPALVQACTTVASGSVSSLTCSGMPAYGDYKLSISVTGLSANAWLTLQFNGDGGNNYGYYDWQPISNTKTTSTGKASILIDDPKSGVSTARYVTCDIWDNVGTGAILSCNTAYDTASFAAFVITYGSWAGTAQITSITVSTSSGTINTGSGMTAWGLKG